MWWLYSVARNYWDVICRELEKIYKRNFKALPELLLLGLKFESIATNDRTSLWYLTTVARLHYAALWKKAHAPTLETWIISIINTTEMDKLTRKIRLQGE